MAKRNLSLEKILSCAAERIDRTGRNDVSLGELAEDLGVQPSALYNHVQNLDGLAFISSCENDESRKGGSLKVEVAKRFHNFRSREVPTVWDSLHIDKYCKGWFRAEIWQSL